MSTFAPAVADHPIRAVDGVVAPANDGDHVIDVLTGHLGDAAVVGKDGGCVDAARDGAARVDLLGHRIRT